MCRSSQSWSQRSDDGYSDDDDDDAAFDVEETEDAGACSEEDDAIVMSGVDLANEQEQQIDKIAGLFDLSRVAASSLLRRYAWKEERLIEEVLSDRERALDKAGVKRQRSDAGPSTDSFECGVCFADYCATDGSALRCGHRFCNSCWKMHLTAQLGDGNAQAIRCMHDECTALVEPALAQALLDGASYAKFARFAQRQFVDDSPLLKWCPAPGCDFVIKVRDLSRTECACACGMTFCFQCSREAHAPLLCETLTRWEDKVKDDSATGQWMSANAKRCPKCHMHIE
ncbi:hypothetical protein EMIHUDRAFT_415290, partial [Emiliania huxleyi CCMP1516]|uniref:RBR-type E3 ubiquitin transferase n=3 Tax=Emiliania huxleyi TaxID=2903 RepID=A0A0D3K5K9_EMIH1